MGTSTRRAGSAASRRRSGEQALRPRARFLRTFGDELISSETVALIELVKNSYDADATRVLIRFTGPLEASQGMIEVIDNGHGMSLDTIRTAWMEPATLVKRQRSRSEKFGRRVLGEKGIGRFAASRLAERLDVVTKRDEVANQTQVLFDWTQFDDPDLFLDEVKVSWYQQPASEFARLGAVRALWGPDEDPIDAELRHGTILRMQTLNSDWGKAEFGRLRSGLARLVSPFSGSAGDRLQSSSLAIALEVPEPFSEFSGPIGPPDTLESPHYRLHGAVDDRGEHTVDIWLKGQQHPDSVRGGTLREEEHNGCGPFEIELRVWDRDTGSLGELASTHNSTVSSFRRDLDAVAGISIYRDGFRVLPYGERDDDWLRLDLRRVQNPTLRLSNNQIVGYVLIGADSNPLLKDQSNREGLVEGPALEQLREKLKELLALVETRRYALRNESRAGKAHRRGLFQDFTLSDVRDYIGKRYPNNTELMTLVRDKDADLGRRVEEVQEVLSRYHRLATLGNLVDTVLHDGRAPLGKIAQAALMARRELDRVSQLSSVAIGKLRERLAIVSDQATVLGQMFRRIEPFGGRRRGRPRQLEIERVIKDAFGVLSSDILRLHVKTELPSGSTTIRAVPSDIQEVFVNLLSNSLHWLQNVDKGHRRIRVEIEQRTADQIQIVFSDSGPGVEPQFRDRIFDPYFSTKPDGVGLGLAITGEIVNDFYGGELHLLKSGPLSGATFRVELPRTS